ncbi:hypothetical protein OSTOST_01219, partial [Ostertagia ostertagi]
MDDNYQRFSQVVHIDLSSFVPFKFPRSRVLKCPVELAISSSKKNFLSNYEAASDLRRRYSNFSATINTKCHSGQYSVVMWRKPEALANYFSNVFSSEYSDSWHSTNSPMSVNVTLYCLCLSKKLHPSTTEPYDGIPQLVYKKCHAFLSKPLTIMFNLSFLTGDLPKLWKHAIVTAIQKSPNSNLLSNFPTD